MDEQNQARIGFTVNLLFDQIGAIFFVTLIYVIIKYKNLRKQHCLKLIGIFMFCNLFSKFIIWGPYLIRVVPLVNMPMLFCCGWYLITLTPLVGQLPFAMLIAFDRAVSVYFPIWYCNPFGKKSYMIILCLIGSLYPAYNAYSLGKIIAEKPFISTNCTSGEIFQFESIDVQFVYVTIGCYILMFVKLLLSSKDRKSYFNKQPLFKAITMLMVIQVGGWLLMKFSYQYIPKLFFNNATENSMPLLYYTLNCFSSITITAEFFALYITSSEHRKALKKEFPRLYYFFPDKFFDKKTRVVKLENGQGGNQVYPLNTSTMATN